MKFIKDFLFLNLADYENIGINMPIGAVLIFLTDAMIVFAFYTNYIKTSSSALCSRLLRYGAIGEEKGKKLRELRLDGSLGIKMALKSGGELSSIVKRVGEKKMTYEEYVEASSKKGYKEEKIDLGEASFYIVPEKTDSAKKIASANHSILSPVILSVVLVGILVLCAFFLPDLLALINK